MKLEWIWELLPTLCKAGRWLMRRREPNLPVLLVVEDDPLDAELLQITLRKRGFQTEVATSGEVAEGLCRHTFYPVVFIDMRLPGMSGAALMRVLSKQAPNTNQVVVCGEPHDLWELPASRFVSVIRKPVTLDAIEEMCEKLKV